MKKELGQSELPVSRKDPKTTRKCYSGRLSNFEQFLGLFLKLVAAIDQIVFDTPLDRSATISIIAFLGFWSFFGAQPRGLKTFVEGLKQFLW